MSKIRIDDKLERLLIQAGMVKEIPIPDKEVIEALRKNGFSFEKALPVFERVQWTFGDIKNSKAVVSFTPGEIKAVVDEIALFEIEKIANGKIVFGIYYKINGFVSPTIKALKKVKDMLNEKPKIVRLRL
jgi:hypothetical protein